MSKLWHGADKNTKIRFLRALIFPIATYGCESWTINKTSERKINAFELKCYRTILRVPWTEKRTNNSILQELNIKEEWLLSTIIKRKLKYCGHVKRHEGSRKRYWKDKNKGSPKKKMEPRHHGKDEDHYHTSWTHCPRSNGVQGGCHRRDVPHGTCYLTSFSASAKSEAHPKRNWRSRSRSRNSRFARPPYSFSKPRLAQVILTILVHKQ